MFFTYGIQFQIRKNDVFMEINDGYKVPNLEKGIAILELLSWHIVGLTLQDIRVETDISQTSAYRMLNTLVRLGYLIYDDESKRYRLSRKILTMGFRTLGEHGLLEAVLPNLRELRNQVKETAFFGVLGEQKGIFIEQAEGLHTFKFLLSPGKEFELHCSAPGKAMLAFLPDSMRNHYISGMSFERFTPHTITKPEVFLETLENVRRLGYAVDMEEQLIGVACVGAPVFNYTSYPCGAIWVSGPIGRFDREAIAAVVPQLLATTRKISIEMGYIVA